MGALKKHDDGTPDDVMVVATAGQLRALVRAAVREELEGTKAEPTPEYLTTHQVAELLQTSPRNVRYFVTRGQLPALRVGTEYRFKRSTVLEYMEQREKGQDA